jgi:hypothetical protein
MKASRFFMMVGIAGLLLVPFASAQMTSPPEWKPLFNGTNLDGWHLKVPATDRDVPSWAAVNGVLVNVPPSERGRHGIDLVSDITLGSHELYIEFMVPKGSNSGVYIIGQYEIQVFDSFGVNPPSKTDCGGIYNIIAPSENASLPPGVWQCFHVIFHKAKVDKSGKVLQKPRITVYHNGKLVIDNQEIEGVTGAALNDNVIEQGPLYLQGNHGMVFYRNIYYKLIEE